jgi:hypothetical protein
MNTTIFTLNTEAIYHEHTALPHHENGGSMALRDDGILPLYYTVSEQQYESYFPYSYWSN